MNILTAMICVIIAGDGWRGQRMVMVMMMVVVVGMLILIIVIIIVGRKVFLVEGLLVVNVHIETSKSRSFLPVGNVRHLNNNFCSFQCNLIKYINMSRNITYFN